MPDATVLSVATKHKMANSRKLLFIQMKLLMLNFPGVNEEASQMEGLLFGMS